MSFRIDDILRNSESSPKSRDAEEPSPNHRGDERDESLLNLGHHHHHHQQQHHQESILQQTLLNRQLSYYRSAMDHQNFRMLPNLYYEKLYGSYNNGFEPYGLDKVGGFSSVCSRTRFWPMYPHPVVLPLPYAHYSKRKGGQVRFTASQTDALEKRFNSNKYLSPEDRRVLADSLKLTDRQVKTWFQNRRAKWRRCNSVSSNSQTERTEDSESDPEICDDTPDHEKVDTNN